jgi:hypothetical protein
MIRDNAREIRGWFGGLPPGRRGACFPVASDIGPVPTSRCPLWHDFPNTKWPYAQEASAGDLTGTDKLHHQSQRFPKFLA